jgi:quinol monooxygenase YgiN
MPFVIIATMVPVPEQRDALVTLLEAVCVQAQTVPGTEIYALHEGAEGRLVLIEKFADEDGMRAHRADTKLAEIAAPLRGLLSEPMDVQVLTPHPAGDEKGTL